MQAPEHNLALDLVRVTEAAALASCRWLGKGDKIAGDKAAVDAMRVTFNAINISGVVVIGEGEKDEAPMLYCGEKIGAGSGPEMDVAVDPIEGTNLLASGRPNAISVVGASPRGSMYSPPGSYYMKKLVVPAAAKNAVDITAPVKENLFKIAKALGKDVRDLVVFVLDKPRHVQLIKEIREAGASIQLHRDGDVYGALMAVDPRSEVDVMMGTGGTPEGVLAACAIRCMGGELFGMLDPQKTLEKQNLMEFGIDLRRIYTVDTLVKTEDCYFVATGISGGSLIGGVRYTGSGAITHSLVMRGKTGTVRYLETHLNFKKLAGISAVKYD